jgi:hypothetical protein
MYSGIFSNHLKTCIKILQKIFSQPTGIMYCIFKKYAAGILQFNVDEELLKSVLFLLISIKIIQIERKLLGRLNIQNFKVRFVCGYLIGTEYELFKIFQSDDYFIFSVDDRKIYLFDKELDKLDISENQSNQGTIIDQLKERMNNWKNV